MGLPSLNLLQIPFYVLIAGAAAIGFSIVKVARVLQGMENPLIKHEESVGLTMCRMEVRSGKRLPRTVAQCVSRLFWPWNGHGHARGWPRKPFS